MKRIIAIFAVAGTFAFAAYAGSLDRTAPNVTAFTVSCGTTPTAILPASGLNSYNEVRCGASHGTPVYVGGPTVDTTEGYPICISSNCIENALTMSVGLGHCVVSTGTETIHCIALSE